MQLARHPRIDADDTHENEEQQAHDNQATQYDSFSSHIPRSLIQFPAGYITISCAAAGQISGGSRFPGRSQKSKGQ
jgi:hypothetical protein